jgi:hypothetical protein
MSTSPVHEQDSIERLSRTLPETPAPPACPRCLGENLEYRTYDYGIDRETGYADSGERYYCRDCGATGDISDAVAPALAHRPTAPVRAAAALPEVA